MVRGGTTRVNLKTKVEKNARTKKDTYQKGYSFFEVQLFIFKVHMNIPILLRYRKINIFKVQEDILIFIYLKHCRWDYFCKLIN